MRSNSRRLHRLALAALALASAGCVIISRSVAIEALPTATSDSATVKSPVKAHLVDGSTLVYPGGATVVRDHVRGAGTRHSATLAPMAMPDSVPLDSVLGMETFRTQANAGRTLAYSLLGTAATLAGTAVASVAIFGSCPTFYMDSAGTPVLEAEGFSYSIAPLLEARDVDRLRARPGPDGVLRLQVWNEALETHYINQLALVEATHRADETVVPDRDGRPLAHGATIGGMRARDRRGNDVTSAVAHHDGRLFATDVATLERVSMTDMEDYIELAVPRPAGTDSVAVVLRMRNSLLNTILFYDYMLARPGARSLDWVEQDLARIAPTVELGRWFTGRLGMRIHLLGEQGWEPVAKLADYGPIAWRDVAAVVPNRGSGDSLRIRLSFVADQWRIDRIAVASNVRRVPTRTVEASWVEGATGARERVPHRAIGAADEEYLQTSPSQRFTVGFDVGRDTPDAARTFLLVSQGYYTEWVRGAWMKGRRDTTVFVPADESLLRALRTWRAEKDSMEKQFYLSRIPVQ